MKKIILIIYVLIIPSVKSFSQLQDTIYLKNDNIFLNSIQLSESTNFNINLSLSLYKENFIFLNDKTSLDIEYKDRKSTRLNSSHVRISYAVFCLKKKK